MGEEEKSSKKRKKQNVEEETEGGKSAKKRKSSISGTKSYEERLKNVSIISKPMASRKLTKKAYKLVKKASSSKCVRRGVKEVVKSLRKGEKGFCILAGDISPIDVISHIPIYCEEQDVPYVYVPSKQDLGGAALTKRPTSVVLIKEKKGFSSQELLDEIVEEAKSLAVKY
mmetsp:Transcript_30451/g.40223  ORF Transcript_30451/g.40223 Transcript_30451/m.40223 type:complete len:171 (-) Transcript_30451:382-894(-)